MINSVRFGKVKEIFFLPAAQDDLTPEKVKLTPKQKHELLQQIQVCDEAANRDKCLYQRDELVLVDHDECYVINNSETDDIVKFQDGMCEANLAAREENQRRAILKQPLLEDGAESFYQKFYDEFVETAKAEGRVESTIVYYNRDGDKLTLDPSYPNRK